MSASASPATGRRYGLARVCAVWGAARSTVYARRARAVAVRAPARRGPKPKIPDAPLLAAIREDLAASPFVGEGHRKTWARLRIQREIRVSRNRVLRLMRESRLLSPHRSRQREARLHEGTITTEAPNEMWGADGLRVWTVEDGWGWVFGTVDHFNAECMGFHVAKVGSRFAALEPVAQGVLAEFGSVGADVARGLKLRMDHGSQYLSDHFQNEIRYWGLAPSFAFVEEPQTNGVVERFFRTLREQVLHGRVYRTLKEVRQAVAAFVERYNEEWLIGRLGYKSPRQARRDYEARSARKAA